MLMEFCWCEKFYSCGNYLPNLVEISPEPGNTEEMVIAFKKLCPE